MSMNGSGENPEVTASMPTMVSTPRGQDALRGTCAACGSPLVADPTRKGVNICPNCHTIQKATDQEFTPGSIVGDYRILKKLAQGGMGLLYLCCPVNDMSRRVVMKTLRLELGENHEVYARRFKRETQLLSSLKHDLIVQVYDYWSDESNAYLIMEYIDGETLESIRNKNQFLFDEPTLIEIMLQVADALKYAWDTQKILHRDVKPSNIMLDRNDYLHLLDFGIAKSLDTQETTALTIAGQGLGTPGYMSLEQFRNTAVDCTTDIYGLGATIYFLATGEPPFTGKNASIVFNEMLKHDPVPLHERNPEFSENFSRLIQSTLNRNPKKRPANWQKLIADLQLVAEGKPPLPD